MSTPLKAGPVRDWKVRQSSGNVFSCSDLTTLQRWVVEGKVTRDDSISVNGEVWKRLGDIAELSSFFQVAEEASRARAFEASLQVIPARASVAAPPPVARLEAPSSSHAADDPLFHTLRGPAFSAPAPTEVPASAPASAARIPDWVTVAVAIAGLSVVGFFLFSPFKQNDAPTDNVTTPPRVLATTEVREAAQPKVEVLPSDAPTTTPAAADAAVAAAATVVTEPVRSADWHVSQGNRQRNAGQAESAFRSYGRALEQAPDNTEALTGQGLSLLELGQLLPAQAILERALTTNSRYGPALIGLAECFRTQNRNGEAIAAFQRYLDLLPEGSEAANAKQRLEALRGAEP